MLYPVISLGLKASKYVEVCGEQGTKTHSGEIEKSSLGQLCYTDDILVTGEPDHLQNLVEVLK